MIFVIFSTPGIRSRNSQSVRAVGNFAADCAASRAQECFRRTRATYILCSTSVYTRRTDCRATHTVAHTLTRCFITADLAGAQTRNGSLITTATAINPGMRERQKRQQWDPLLRFTASRN